jgi:hypothetical protein
MNNLSQEERFYIYQSMVDRGRIQLNAQEIQVLINHFREYNKGIQFPVFMGLTPQDLENIYNEFGSSHPDGTLAKTQMHNSQQTIPTQNINNAAKDVKVLIASLFVTFVILIGGIPLGLKYFKANNSSTIPEPEVTITPTPKLPNIEGGSSVETEETKPTEEPIVEEPVVKPTRRPRRPRVIITPKPTVTPTIKPTPTPTPSPTPTNSPSPTITPTPIITVQPTPIITPTPIDIKKELPDYEKKSPIHKDKIEGGVKPEIPPTPSDIIVPTTESP